MSCINKKGYNKLVARKEKIDKTLEKLYDALSNFNEVEGYTFDSGEGRQQTKYRSTEEILRTIRRLEAASDLIERKLNGTGTFALNLRRRK